MAVADRVRTYLAKRGIVHSIHDLPPLTSLRQLADTWEGHSSRLVQGIVLKHDLGLLLIAMSATHSLYLDALSKLLGRRMELADEARVKAVFSDCLPQFLPPLGEVYGVRMLVDESIALAKDLYFPGGGADQLIQMSSRDFFAAQKTTSLVGDFTRPINGH